MGRQLGVKCPAQMHIGKRWNHHLSDSKKPQSLPFKTTSLSHRTISKVRSKGKPLSKRCLAATLSKL